MYTRFGCGKICNSDKTFNKDTEVKMRITKTKIQQKETIGVTTIEKGRS